MSQFISHLVLTLAITSSEFSQERTWRDLPLQYLNQLTPAPAAIDLFHVTPDLCLALTLPMPLSQADIGIMIELLSLSPPQVLYLDHFVPSYADCIEAIRRESIALVQVSGMRAAAAQRQRNYPVFAVEFDQFAAGEQGIRLAILQCDQVLLNSLSEILADTQREAMERWQAMRIRDRLPLDFIETPSAKIDLSAVVRGLVPSSPQLELVCAEYERVVTPVMQRLTDEVFRRRPQVAHERATLELTGDPAIDELRVRSHLDACARIRRDWASLERRVRDINLTYMRRLADALPADLRDQFRRTCLGLFYPAVYPDAGEVHVSVADFAPVEEELAFAIQALLAGYATEYGALCERMERHQDEWFEHLSQSASYKYAGPFEEKRRKLLVDRATLNLRTVERVKSILADGLAGDTLARLDSAAAANRGILARASE